MIERDKRVRVAFLGNMNNNHFAMARYLRDRGVDADVLLFSDELCHFHPSADTYDLNYTSYCRQLTWSGLTWSDCSTPSWRIASELEPYKVIVGCGLAPALCQSIGRSLDIFVPYGGDICGLAQYPSPFFWSRHPVLRWRWVMLQRAGIAKCKVIHAPPVDQLYENRLMELTKDSDRWLEGVPLVYTPTFNPETILACANRTHWAHEFIKVRDENEFMLLNHARHVFTGGGMHDKGTDNLLRGWALFKKQKSLMRSVLVTLEYGSDVEKSKRLVEELGISDSVRWLPRMLRKDLMIGVALSDVVCGDFTYSWTCSGVLYEALAMAKPILAYRNDQMHQQKRVDLYPILNARSSEDIASRLNEYCESREKCIEQGEYGRLWYERIVVQPVLEKYLGYIQKASCGSG